MERLIVSIEHNGEMIPAGFISGNSSADSCFCYSMEYLHREGSTPVSVSLPLQETPFSAAQTRTFFEGDELRQRSRIKLVHAYLLSGYETRSAAGRRTRNANKKDSLLLPFAERLSL